MRRLRPTSRRGDRGQATLELVAMVPFVLFVTATLLQLAAVVWAITDTTEAARQGARASSMGDDGCSAARAALSGSLTTTSCGAGGGSLAMEVRAPIIVPGFEDVVIRRAATLPDVSDR